MADTTQEYDEEADNDHWRKAVDSQKSVRSNFDRFGTESSW
jgi:hypothetical protein